MAKDKSKSKPEKSGKGKADKPAKVKGGGFSDGFAQPSEAPAGGDGWAFEHADNIGEVFLITPLREEEHEDKFSKTPGAIRKHIVADVVKLNLKSPAKSELHADAWVFGGYTQGSLRGFIGERRVVGVLQRDVGDKVLKSRQEPWYLEDAKPKHLEAAKAYLDSLDPLR